MVYIFTGIAFIIKGIARICGLLTILSKRERKLLKEEDVPSYLRRNGILECVLGILFICMGIIEEYNLLPVWMFFAIYAFLCGAIQVGICINNKKYLGHFLSLVELLIIIAVVVVLFCVLIYTQCYDRTVFPKSIVLESVTVKEDYITVSGFNYGGMFNYLGYNIKYEEGTLYIKFKGGWELPYMKGTNSPQFYPVPNKYPDLKEIYLWGDGGHENDRLIWTKENGMLNQVKKESYNKIEEKLIGDYKIQQLTYLSPLSSISLDAAKKGAVDKAVSIKDDSLTVGDDVKTSNTKLEVSEMTKSDWKEYHGKYDIEVENQKNTTEFDEKLTYYKADIGDYKFIFSEKEVYMLSNLMIFELKKDK